MHVETKRDVTVREMYWARYLGDALRGCAGRTTDLTPTDVAVRAVAIADEAMRLHEARWGHLRPIEAEDDEAWADLDEADEMVQRETDRERES